MFLCEENVHCLNTLVRMFLESGGAMRDRTADLLNANQALSQLSYSPIEWSLPFHFTMKRESGGRYRARTSDPLLVREVLSQLS